ncbi:MAG TPA: hypothetical protein VEI02_01915 [Planctomycetota bacterium]|nr:hypothetical protein [Planctomycetota bacterium]
MASRIGIILACLAAGGVAQTPDPASLWDAMEKASQDPGRLASVAADVRAFIDAHPRHEQAPMLFGSLGERWRAARRFEAAHAVFEEMARRFPAHLAFARLGAGDVHRAQGDLAKAIVAYEAAASADSHATHRSIMDAGDTRNLAFLKLIDACEAHGENARALAAAERWVPYSWCGTCLMGKERQRRSLIARLSASLGDPAATATRLAPLLSHGDHEVAARWAEAVGRSRGLEDALRLAASLPEGVREPATGALDLVAAWAASDAARVVDAFRKTGPGDGDAFASLAARLLRGLGDPAIVELKRRIEGPDEDCDVILLAGEIADERLRAPLEALFALKARDRLGHAVRDALQRMDAARAKEKDAPATRPSEDPESRPTPKGAK